MTTPLSSLHFNILCKKTPKIFQILYVYPCPPAIMQKFSELANGMEQMQESEEKTSPQMALEKSSKSWNNRLLIALLIAQV